MHIKREETTNRKNEYVHTFLLLLRLLQLQYRLDFLFHFFDILLNRFFTSGTRLLFFFQYPSLRLSRIVGHPEVLVYRDPILLNSFYGNGHASISNILIPHHD